MGFIDRLAREVIGREHPEDLTIVFPNKRPAAFLARALAREKGDAILLPRMLSVTDFLSEQTPWQQAEQFDLLLLLYDAYERLAREKKFRPQSLEQFLGWAPVLLNDFDEIDKFLVPPGDLFGHLSDIKAIEEWGQELNEGDLASDYMRFFESLDELYRLFRRNLASAGLAYRGMIYRRAAQTVEAWARSLGPDSLLFAGFNALTPAEKHITGHLLQAGKARISWDWHRCYEDPPFEAGRYLRQLRNDPAWKPYFPAEAPSDISAGSRHVFVAAPGDQEQVQFVADRLRRLPSGTDWLRTAVVLNDASLLLPLMHALPPDLPAVNVTFGMPVHQMPAVRWWKRYLRLLAVREGGLPADLPALAAFFGSPFVAPDGDPAREELLTRLAQSKLRYLSWDHLPEWLTGNALFDRYFGAADPEGFFCRSASLMDEALGRMSTAVDRDVWLEVRALWQRLSDYRERYGWFDTFGGLEKVFLRLLANLRLAFEGHPLKGLQVMGLLETRLLDFDRVFLLSVNEGILPAVSRTESFLPADLRRRKGLPLHQDHHAVTAYHFYRLVASAREVYYLYNTSATGLSSGEPSRFVAQLKHKLPGCGIRFDEWRLRSGIRSLPVPESLPKDAAALARLRERATGKGFSPSALLSYLHYPLDFYRRYVLGWPEDKIPDAYIAANDMGTVIHQSMERLYRPHLGSALTPALIRKLRSRAGQTVEEVFYTLYLQASPGAGQWLAGKNLLAVEASRALAEKFLHTDEDLVRGGQRLELVALEQNVGNEEASAGERKVFLDVDGVGRVFFSGQLDRLDRLDGGWRMVDYKTGRTKAPRENYFRREPLAFFGRESYKHLLQLWMYIWMGRKAGLLPQGVAVQPVVYSPQGDEVFPAYGPGDDALLEAFLRTLLGEMFDPSRPFGQAEAGSGTR